MAEVERLVRSVATDGLLWGACMSFLVLRIDSDAHWILCCCIFVLEKYEFLCIFARKKFYGLKDMNATTDTAVVSTFHATHIIAQ